MKNKYLLLLLTISLLTAAGSAKAQIVGTDCFLQGTYLEIGMQGNGSFGANTSPSTYHSHPGFGTALAEVYDYGHDGWTVGTPPYMGDYTYPGSPFEGWELQINGGQAQGFQGSGTGYATSGATMTSAPVTYASGGGRKTGTFSGTMTVGTQSLNFVQETRVDALASWVTVTTKFYNTSSTTDVTGVYYMRSCDPDNDETWPGGSFTTNNMVNYQIPNPDNRVEVTATGMSSTLPPLSLATKDCRAVAFIYTCWSLSVTTDLNDLWTRTTSTACGSYFDVGVVHNGDIAIGLVYNIGTIPHGDSAVISYSYVFNGVNGIDSAHPDPELAINNIPITSFPDTLQACSFPGVDTLPVDILYGNDKDWTWGKWTWAPSVGLSSTTGVNNYIHINEIPGYVTYTITGTDTSAGTAMDCNVKTIIFTVHSCHAASANSPCYGDTLQFHMSGDSTSSAGPATYLWTGPLGFRSTLHDPFRYPAVWTDTGLYHVYKTLAGVIDTDSVYVTIHPRPVVTASNNGPLCSGMVDTLLLRATSTIAGGTFIWYKPTIDTAVLSTLQNPSIIGFNGANVGTYAVVATTSYGCKDTAYTVADTIPRPVGPVISDRNPYCQNDPFVPFTVGHPTGSTVYWYPTRAGGTGSTTPSTISTVVPGYYTVYASDKVGSCESLRDSLVVHVITKPLAPIVSGTLNYCQYIGPVTPLHVFADAIDTVDWWTVATGGDSILIEPLPNINVAGTYNYWVSQSDSGCESPRTPVTIKIHPKPNRPVITRQQYCQFHTPAPVIATPSTAGDALTWYGPGVTPGSSIAPTPNTSLAPAFDSFYVHETSTYAGTPTVGCVSDSALDVVPIIQQPAPPVVANVKYCQRDAVVTMNYTVDSFAGSHLNWYDTHGGAIPPVPAPNTFADPGPQSWFVSQVFNGCESDSVQITANIIYKPEFTISARSPWVCQFDSVTVSYNGPVLPPTPGFHWTLPDGAKTVAATNVYQPSIVVEFDSAEVNNIVTLTATDDSGFCSTDTSLNITVVPEPNLNLYTKADVCLGDTMQLALSDRSSGTYAYTWYVDGVLLGSSPAISIVAASSNSGGPYLVKWIDSGRHVVEITTTTTQGCPSAPSYDSVYVHSLPDATFTYTLLPGKTSLCLEDSVEFSASLKNYNYSYLWGPEHSFDNTNSSTQYGLVEQTQSFITLTVTDPFGCSASSSLELDPETCCTVVFPNAFTPGSTRDNLFRPICAGYHKFHSFRIANRWGQTIFESANSSDAAWDGNYNGVPQDMGVYFYYLKYDCGGNTIEEKGDVTLIR